MKCNIRNNSNMNLKDLNPLIDDLASSVQQKIGFNSMPSIVLQDDEDNADVLLGKTAYYDPQNKAVTVYVTNRHPKDILRSIAHELVHHGQNLRGEFDKIGAVGEGYAQNDQHLRNMEKEAYLKGNMCFRDWEDGYKRQMMESIHRQNSFKRRSNTMKKYNSNKNNELNKLLMEKFNFGSKKKEYDLEEGADRIFAPNHYCAHHVVHEGEEAYTVDHNWDEQLQEVTEYDIRFKDGTVKRNISINELEVLEAFNESEHHGNRDEDGNEDHPPVKKTKKKDKKKVEEAHCMGNRDDDKKEDEKDEEQLYRYKNGKIVPVSKEFMAGRKVRKKVMKLLGLDESIDSLDEELENLEEKQFANSDELDADKDGVPKWADKDDKDASVGSKGSKNKGKKKDDKEKNESFRRNVRNLMEQILKLK